MTHQVLDQRGADRSARSLSGLLSRRRVLIADDDADSVAWLCDVLYGTDAQLVTAGSGAELVSALAKHGPFDLLITDIGMPWAEGTAVVRAARASALRMPVLFISGLERPGIAAAVVGLGNARLLRKPVGVATLRAAIADLLTLRLSS